MSKAHKPVSLPSRCRRDWGRDEVTLSRALP